MAPKAVHFYHLYFYTFHFEILLQWKWFLEMISWNYIKILIIISFIIKYIFIFMWYMSFWILQRDILDFTMKSSIQRIHKIYIICFARNRIVQLVIAIFLQYETNSYLNLIFIHETCFSVVFFRLQSHIFRSAYLSFLKENI